MGDLPLWLKAVILGLVEGATEFIPVSSTGHLILFQDWLGWTDQRADTFIIFIQLPAILAVLWLFRRKVWDVASTLGTRAESRRLVINLLVATLPAVVVGLPTEEWIEARLFKPLPVALALLVGGVAILLAERRKREVRVDSVDHIPWKIALGVGLFQVLAMVWPGISRSGATIIGGLFLGLARVAATEFSFFLAIPAMMGATLIKMLDVQFGPGDALIYGIGAVTSFVSALLVVRWLLGFVSRNTFRGFAWYRIVFGLLLLGLYWGRDF